MPDSNTITITVTLDVARFRLYHAAKLVNELMKTGLEYASSVSAIKCARMELEDACVEYVQAFVNDANRKKEESP